MKKITKREVVAFILGITTMLIIVKWDDSVNSFKKGWNEAHEKANIKE